MLTEQWLPVKGYEGNYLVSNLGRVKSLDRKIPHKGGWRTIKGIFKKTRLNRCGYNIINLSKNGYKNSYLLHRLIIEAFISNPEKKRTVNHKNGIKTDNKLENLEWCTYRENSTHAIITGLSHKKRTSKFVGVHWSCCKKKWRVQISINSKNKHLGYFIDELEASNAYKQNLSSLPS